MAASGVSVLDEVITEFNNIKIGHKYRYIQMKMTDDKKAIQIEKVVDADPNKTSNDDEKQVYNEFVHQLPTDDCRYAVYDFHFETVHSGSRDQLIFIVWCPDSAPIKSKMLYASSKEALRKKLVGITHEVQATEFAELNHKEITEKVMSKMVK